MKAKNSISSNEIQEIVNQICKNYNPEKIIVFGSFLKGKLRKDSDIDLMIVKSTQKDYFKRTYEVRRYLDTDIPLDILVYTPQELKERCSLGDYFIQEILDKGKILYEK